MLIKIISVSVIVFLTHLTFKVCSRSIRDISNPAFLQCGDGFLLAVSCDDDCRNTHGSINGTCNLNTICACHYSNDTLFPGPLSATPAPALLTVDHPNLQCQVDDRSTTGTLYAYYLSLCNTDCRCLHGGISGTCDFSTKYCHCNYISSDTYENLNTGNCEYPTRAEAVGNLSALAAKIATTLVSENYTRYFSD